MTQIFKIKIKLKLSKMPRRKRFYKRKQYVSIDERVEKVKELALQVQTEAMQESDKLFQKPDIVKAVFFTRDGQNQPTIQPHVVDPYNSLL